jgi:hypothetical protein
LRRDPTAGLYDDVFRHPDTWNRQRLAAINLQARLKQKRTTATWRMGGEVRHAPSVNTPIVTPRSTPETRPLVTKDQEIPESDLCAVLGRWNRAVRTDPGTQIPQASRMLITDIDCIVDHGYTHLLATLLTQQYIPGHTAELDPFISKVVHRTDYRRMFKSVQHLIPIRLKMYIQQRRVHIGQTILN